MKNIRMLTLCALMISRASYSSNYETLQSATPAKQNHRVAKPLQPMNMNDLSTYWTYEETLAHKINCHLDDHHLDYNYNFTHGSPTLSVRNSNGKITHTVPWDRHGCKAIYNILKKKK